MKKAALFLFLATAILSFVSSCRYSDKYEAVNANNKFILSVPSWMSEEKGLKDGADFQYANRFRNMYVIGEAFSKTGITKTNGQLMADNLNIIRKSLQNPMVTDSVDITAGGIKGTRVEIYGKMSGEDIYFSEVIFDGKTNVYHLSIWTRSGNRKLHFKEDINKIIGSFKEI